MTKAEIKLIADERKATKEHYEARLRGSQDIINLQAAQMHEMSTNQQAQSNHKRKGRPDCAFTDRNDRRGKGILRRYIEWK